MSTLTGPARPAPSSRRPSSVKRLDIQGLRMVAVVAVVVNHLTGHPRGAYVGVDVFFVISGFLITSLLLRDLDRDLGFRGYVVAFYRRRVRRLLPAALTVTVLTLVAARLLLNAARFQSALHDGLWATVFWVNWHFAAAGTNYFAEGSPPSPFQHYWSLSVEEQFYVVWPLLMFVGGVVLVRRSGLHRRRAILVVCVALCVASLAIAAVQSGSDSTYAYFSSLTRAWELGLGALVACVGAGVSAPRRVLTLMSWSGLAVVSASFFLIPAGTNAFPFPWAVLPCLGAVVVLMAVNGDERASNIVLTNPASVFVGDISYSVYLVHFPVIVLLSGRMIDTPWYFYVTALALTAGLSVALYGFVEQPVLRSRWLLADAQRGSRRRGGLAQSSSHFREYGVTALVSVVISLVLLVLWQQQEQAAQIATQNAVASALDNAPPQRPSGGPSATTAPTPLAAALHHKIVTAAKATIWPNLKPSMDSVLAAPASAPDVDKCGAVTLAAADCVFGDPGATHTIEIVGDSQSIAWVPAFQALVARHPAWKVRVAGGYACVFADQLIVTDAGQFSSHCGDRNDAVVADILAVRPDLLVVSDRWTRPEDLASTSAEIAKTGDAPGSVLMLAQPPPVTDPHTCYHPGSSPVDCLTRLDPVNSEIIDNERATMADAGGSFIDTTNWFCTSGFCPAFVGAIPTYFDSGHVSQAYARSLGPVLDEALQAQGLLD